MDEEVKAFVAHLRAEIERLTTLHRAEQEHNRRLAAACSRYRSAAHVGLESLRNSQDDYKTAFDDIIEDINGGDALAFPVAADAK